MLRLPTPLAMFRPLPSPAHQDWGPGTLCHPHPALSAGLCCLYPLCSQPSGSRTPHSRASTWPHMPGSGPRGPMLPLPTPWAVYAHGVPRPAHWDWGSGTPCHPCPALCAQIGVPGIHAAFAIRLQSPALLLPSPTCLDQGPGGPYCLCPLHRQCLGLCPALCTGLQGPVPLPSGLTC